jgi:N-acetylneuraminic acid mutarotase
VGWCGSEIVCAGGTWWEGPTKRYTDEVHAYDPARDRWRDLPRYPVPIAYAGTASAGRDLLVAGGWTGTEPVLRCYRLRPGAEARWERLPDLPGPRVFSAAAVVDSTLYLIAGAADFAMTGGPFADAIRLDLRRPGRGWQSCAPLPGKGRCILSAAACGGRIYLFGGYSTEKKEPPAFADAFSYDPKRDRWSRLADLPGTLYAAASGSVDDRYVYLLGGLDTDRKVQVAEGSPYPFASKVLIYDTRGDSYREGTPLPRPVAPDCGLTDGRRFFVMGGEVGFHVRSPWTFIGELGRRPSRGGGEPRKDGKP